MTTTSWSALFHAASDDLIQSSLDFFVRRTANECSGGRVEIHISDQSLHGVLCGAEPDRNVPGKTFFKKSRFTRIKRIANTGAQPSPDGTPCCFGIRQRKRRRLYLRRRIFIRVFHNCSPSPSPCSPLAFQCADA